MVLATGISMQRTMRASVSCSASARRSVPATASVQTCTHQKTTQRPNMFHKHVTVVQGPASKILPSVQKSSWCSPVSASAGADLDYDVDVDERIPVTVRSLGCVADSKAAQGGNRQPLSSIIIK